MCVPCAPDSVSQGIFSFGNVFRCYLKCRKNKRNTVNALKFEIDSEENIFNLQKELARKIYRPSRSLLFPVAKPKLREIFAADFRDRIVHHILIDKLEKIWEPIFIHDSYACRANKGTHKAVTRLQGFLRKITKNGNVRAWYLQLDIKDFFTSIDKSILFELLKKKISDVNALWLTHKIIFWDCTQDYIQRGDRRLLQSIPPNKSLFGKNNLKGLPIGNLTSQFFANVYLNEMDQFIKHTLKCHYYLRYADDFILLSPEKNYLIEARNEIENFISDRFKIKLNAKRTKLRVVSSGIDFLGYIIRNGYILVRRRVINNFKDKIRRITNKNKLKEISASYFGHFSWANSYKLMKNIRIFI